MASAVRIRALPSKWLQPSPTLMRLTSYVLLALVFFLLGFLPLWANSREATMRHSETEHGLRVAQMQNALGSAVINAQGGGYEMALQSASSFYSSLQTEIDRREASGFSLMQQAELVPLLGGRDDVVALIARGDPAASARLSELYGSFSQIVTGQAAIGVEARATERRESISEKQAP